MVFIHHGLKIRIHIWSKMDQSNNTIHQTSKKNVKYQLCGPKKNLIPQEVCLYCFLYGSSIIVVFEDLLKWCCHFGFKICHPTFKANS